MRLDGNGWWKKSQKRPIVQVVSHRLHSDLYAYWQEGREKGIIITQNTGNLCQNFQVLGRMQTGEKSVNVQVKYRYK